MVAISYNMNFKLVYTCEVFSFQVNPSWTALQLYQSIQNLVLQRFHLVRFEIVEAGQDTTYGHAEQAEALDLTMDDTLQTLYGDRIINTSFYIREIYTPNSNNI
jgi:hypothetical protein